MLPWSRSFASTSSEGSRVVQPSVASRHHALDALRAAMMFLGIYLHAVVAYSPHGGWPFKPPQLTTTLDFSMILLHVFRMPVFYVMAGFFAALLLQRYGSRRAIVNRFWRIVVPFVVGWIIIYPLVMFMTAFGRRGLDPAIDFILSGRFLDYAHPLHLWFLEYLIVFYVLAAILVVALPLVVPAGARARLIGAFQSIVQSVWAPLPFGVLSFLALLLMAHPWLEDPPGFVPAASLVVAYGIPFGFGWLLFLNAHLLDVLARRAWLYMAAAVVAFIAYYMLLYSFADRGMAFYGLRAAHALAMWCLILGSHRPVPALPLRPQRARALSLRFLVLPLYRPSAGDPAVPADPARRAAAAAGQGRAGTGGDHRRAAAALSLRRAADLHRGRAQRPEISRRAHADSRHCRLERNEMRWNRMRFHLISFARTGDRGSRGRDGSG